jgi:hypothetical protein
MDRTADAALRMFDKLLEERPKRVGHDFSEATRWTVAFRDELIAEWRRTETDADRRRLEKVNAVLSVLLGGHYPLGEVPWPHLEKARAQLAKV